MAFVPPSKEQIEAAIRKKFESEIATQLQYSASAERYAELLEVEMLTKLECEHVMEERFDLDRQSYVICAKCSFECVHR